MGQLDVSREATEAGKTAWGLPGLCVWPHWCRRSLWVLYLWDIPYKQYSASDREMKQLKGQCWSQFYCRCRLVFLHGFIKGFSTLKWLCSYVMSLCVSHDFVLLFAHNTEVLKYRSDKSHEGGCVDGEYQHHSWGHWGHVLWIYFAVILDVLKTWGAVYILQLIVEFRFSILHAWVCPWLTKLNYSKRILE